MHKNKLQDSIKGKKLFYKRMSSSKHEETNSSDVRREESLSNEMS